MYSQRFLGGVHEYLLYRRWMQISLFISSSSTSLNDQMIIVWDQSGYATEKPILTTPFFFLPGVILMRLQRSSRERYTENTVE